MVAEGWGMLLLSLPATSSSGRGPERFSCSLFSRSINPRTSALLTASSRSSGGCPGGRASSGPELFSCAMCGFSSVCSFFSETGGIIPVIPIIISASFLACSLSGSLSFINSSNLPFEAAMTISSASREVSSLSSLPNERFRPKGVDGGLGRGFSFLGILTPFSL